VTWSEKSVDAHMRRAADRLKDVVGKHAFLRVWCGASRLEPGADNEIMGVIIRRWLHLY
jgi:hypothetical protein